MSTHAYTHGYDICMVMVVFARMDVFVCACVSTYANMPVYGCVYVCLCVCPSLHLHVSLLYYFLASQFHSSFHVRQSSRRNSRIAYVSMMLYRLDTMCCRVVFRSCQAVPFVFDLLDSALYLN